MTGIKVLRIFAALLLDDIRSLMHGMATEATENRPRVSEFIILHHRRRSDTEVLIPCVSRSIARPCSWRGARHVVSASLDGHMSPPVEQRRDYDTLSLVAAELRDFAQAT
jgi:hypothetical protein